MAPKRTREHELEDESRTALSSALPGGWVVRSVEKDYGIDAEVELFRDGEPTGLSFKVQLKGTDSLHGRPAHRSIKLTHLRYWQSLDVPVLIVLYVSDTKEIYVKWSFAHDPGLKGYSQKTTTVHFSESDQLIYRVSALAFELQLYRPLADGRIDIPVPVDVTSRSDTPTSRYKFQQLFQARTHEYELDGIVRVASATAEPALSMKFSPQFLTLSMPLNAGSISIHPKRGEVFELSDEEAIDTTLILVASLLATRSETARALRICEAVGPADVWFLPEVATRFSAVFDAEARHDISLSIGNFLLSNASDLYDLQLAALYAEPARYHVRTMSEIERKKVTTLFESLSSKFQELGDAQGASAQLTNLAGIHSTLNDYVSAVDRLTAAHLLSPDLLEVPVFLDVLAGNAFRAGQRALSAEMYGRVVALLRGNKESLPENLLSHWADALFSSGSYGLALEVIEGKFGSPLTDRLSIVNGLACHEIIQVTGLESQELRNLTDEEIEAVESDPGKAIELLKVASALDFMLWYQLEPHPEGWSLSRSCLLARLNLPAASIWLVATLLACEQFDIKSHVVRGITEMAVYDAKEPYLEMLRALQAEDSDGVLEPLCELAHDIALTASVDNDLFATYGMSPLFDD